MDKQPIYVESTLRRLRCQNRDRHMKKLVIRKCRKDHKTKKNTDLTSSKYETIDAKDQPIKNSLTLHSQVSRVGGFVSKAVGGQASVFSPVYSFHILYSKVYVIRRQTNPGVVTKRWSSLIPWYFWYRVPHSVANKGSIVSFFFSYILRMGRDPWYVYKRKLSVSLWCFVNSKQKQQRLRITCVMGYFLGFNKYLNFCCRHQQ